MPNIAEQEARLEQIDFIADFSDGGGWDKTSEIDQQNALADCLSICKERGKEIERLKKELEMFKRIKEPSEGEIHNQEHKP